MYLIDTDVAIHLRDRTGNMAARVAERAFRPVLSVLTLAELEGGVAAVPELRAARRFAFEAMTATLTVLPLTREIVAGYGTIVAARGFSRRRVIDRLIAATAIAHSLTLVTINGEDFRDIPGLSLDVWPLQ